MRRRIVETRFDFRGGVNHTLAPELLTPNELLRAQNVRIGERGTIRKRTGHQALFDTTSYGAISGVPYWWEYGRDLYFFAGADEIVKWDYGTGALSVVVTGIGSSNYAPHAWEPFPVSSFNKLFLATNAALTYIDAGALNNVTRPSGANSCMFLDSYQGRLWTGQQQYIEWSAPSDGSDFSLASGGGYADVDFGEGGFLYGIAAIGSSLLLLREKQINRLTLTGAENIDIARDSEGLASDIGMLESLNGKPYCIAENRVYFASMNGIYVASESEVMPISQKVESTLLDLLAVESPFLVHHGERHEIRVLFEDAFTWWTFNYRTGAWTGPHSSFYKYSEMAPYEAGKACAVLGSQIFDMDSGYLDGATEAGTGGVRYEAEIEFPPFLFRDPRQIKTVQGVSSLEADLGADTHVTLSWSSEMGNGSIELHSKGEGVRSYPFRLRARGRRISIVITENLESAVELTGLVLEAVKGRRGG